MEVYWILIFDSPRVREADGISQPKSSLLFSPATYILAACSFYPLSTIHYPQCSCAWFGYPAS